MTRSEAHNRIEELPTYSTHEHVEDIFNSLEQKLRKSRAEALDEITFSYEYALGYSDALSKILEELRSE